MPLEPRLKPLIALSNRLDRSGAEVFLPIERQSGNRQARQFGRVVMRKGGVVASQTNHMVPVDGGYILMRIYRPHAGRLPLHLFIHGGGFCAGDLDQRDVRCQDLAVGAGCVVASVDYRLAPENQYPTAPEDCYAALRWLAEQASELDIDPRVISVGGESAGGNLAAVLCLMTRDRSGPPLCFQMLEVPVTDLTMSFPSVDTFASGYLLTKKGMQEYVHWYIGDPSRITEPYASPYHAADLSGLPPAWVMTCEFDPLHDEGEAYAMRLREAGVPTEYMQLDGHVHGSFALTRLLPSSREYQRQAEAALRAAHRAAVEGALSPS